MAPVKAPNGRGATPPRSPRVGRRRLAALVAAPAGLALVALLAGCGADTTVSTSPTSPSTSVTVTVVDGDTTTMTLTCVTDPGDGEQNGGDHPDVDSACSALLAAESADPSPLDPVPADLLCTQIYGGAQTATIEGVVDGETVSVELSRTDGCEIARWDALLPVLQNLGGE